MTPMPTIPDDIRQLADLAATATGHTDPVLITAICAVLMRERERCAKVAENTARDIASGELFVIGGAVAVLRQAADRIRNGTPSP